MRRRTPLATYPGTVWATRGIAACSPIWSCSRRGLPCHRRCRRRGALLPTPFHPYRPSAHDACSAMEQRLRAPGFGGMFSVALSVGSRPPGVTWRLALWSPDFPPRGDPSPGDPDDAPTRSDCPADSLYTTIEQPDTRGKLLHQHGLREVVAETFVRPLNEITLNQVHAGHPQLRDDL